jgi:translation initiation factor SUI1
MDPINFQTNLIGVIEDDLEPVIITLQFSKRNSRKGWTIIIGLDKTDIDIKKFVKRLRKILHCSGAIKINKSTKEQVIQLQGEHRDKIELILIDEKISTAENIKRVG